MSNIRMTRINIDRVTWNRFAAQCREMEIPIPDRLGALILGAVTRKERRRTSWLRDET